MDIGQQNETWANELINTLLTQGIDYFCCGPGSRSTPLALAVARLSESLHTVHFDERGVCFHAVGYGKASGKPAVVITTSGTAVGNLLPGIMEACNQRVPLIILTADRPPELRDCGANQTCDQVKLFANHVRWQIDLPCPSEHIPKHYLASTICQAVAISQSSPAGPVHINCMFREPLFSLQEKTRSAQVKIKAFAHPELHPSSETVDFWLEALSDVEKGVIIAGSNSDDSSRAILALAEQLQWPVFADILSGPRGVGEHNCLIPHFDSILKSKGEIKADAIIQFGDRFVSKTLAQWLEKQTPQFYLHISEHPLRQDPFHLITHRVHASATLFVQKLLKSLPPREEEQWLTQWSLWDQKCRELLSDLFAKDFKESITEPSLIPPIASLLSEDWALFLANSMPIRDANLFFNSQISCGPIFGNRGVSGIDGNIATAAGIAKATRKPTLALLGDLAFLHDLNSLAYLNKIDLPLLLCVVNNGGGGIFSFLPISQRGESFEKFFAAAHEITFAPAAALFGIPYFHATSLSELKELFFEQKKSPRSCIIEITTDRAQNVQIHESINAAISRCLNSACSPEETLAILH